MNGSPVSCHHQDFLGQLNSTKNTSDVFDPVVSSGAESGCCPVFVSSGLERI